MIVTGIQVYHGHVILKIVDSLKTKGQVVLSGHQERDLLDLLRKRERDQPTKFEEQ